MDIDRPLQDGLGVLAVDGVEELIPGQDPAVGLEQGDEEPELDGRERHVPAGDHGRVASAIDDEVAVDQDLRRSA